MSSGNVGCDALVRKMSPPNDLAPVLRSEFATVFSAKQAAAIFVVGIGSSLPTLNGTGVAQAETVIVERRSAEM
tara:strand:+ start:13322 stop:13543 length:222 start_codon:yes stop_codon:yes gene_type:complete